MKRRFPLIPLFAPLFAAAVLLVAVCALFSGCYTLTQGSTLLGYLGKAVPLETLPENDGFVERVQDIRRFAMEELGLKKSKNYTQYVQLDRDYLAAVVSAAEKDSFTSYVWKYPVVGPMPYKGFFNVEDARKERAKLEKKGLDVWVRGVGAFSTLGWFKDPLYSYMRNYAPYQLADLIIHESMHATVFIKGQVQFNEELAEVVGTEGGRLYVESRFGIDSDEYRAMVASQEDNRNYVAFLHGLIAELQEVYTSGADQAEKLREKERIINTAQERFDAEYETRFTSDNYRKFSTMPVNNAYLELYRLYYAAEAAPNKDTVQEAAAPPEEDALKAAVPKEPSVASLFEKSGKDLPAFIAAAKTLPKKASKKESNRKEQLAKALGL